MDVLSLRRLVSLVATAAVLADCGSGSREQGNADSTAMAAQAAAPAPTPGAASANSSPTDSMFAAVADSAWVPVEGLSLIAFYPIASNDSLEADEGLATALDDLSYHIGSAMDSLMAVGFTVHYRGGDTLWLRTGTKRARIVRMRDSASVGYVFADTLGRRTLLYGVRSNIDLIEYAHEFRATGQIRPR